MAGGSRVVGWSRVLGPGAAACLVAGIGACSAGAATSPGFGPIGGSGGSEQAGPGLTLGGFPSIDSNGGDAPCQPAAASGLFTPSALNNRAPARRELYSWTTDEQAAELRDTKVLFSRTERPGLGRGYVFEALQNLATQIAANAPTTTDQQQLIAVLDGDLFAKARFAWPEPWATRLGWPGEDYGGQLLKIVLKPEAWIVIFDGNELSVVDLGNAPVAIADALAHPERIGAIFFNKSGFAGGPVCNGSFSGGSNGYREFVLGNEGMVEEWSLGTEAIRDRLSADIALVQKFLPILRGCPVTVSPAIWNLQVSCGWSEPELPITSEIDAYQAALCIPSANYIPEPGPIASLIETLQGALFDPNPLVVTEGAQ